VCSSDLDRNKSREQAGEGRCEAHRAHGQSAVEHRQRERTLKTADSCEEQIVRAWKSKVGSEANGQQNEQGDKVTRGDDQQSWSSTRAHAANEV
jgi:hypothetical protein